MPRVDAVRWCRERGAQITVIVWSLNVIILAVVSIQLGSQIPAALPLVAGGSLSAARGLRSGSCCGVRGSVLLPTTSSVPDVPR
jgi:hypothetical protein